VAQAKAHLPPRHHGPLERASYVRAVLARNPNIESARQAWRAALAQYPQEAALDDPTLEYAFAPLSIGSSEVPYGQQITLSQMFPWPGKRGLAAEATLAEAEAAREDYHATRLQLALMASLLFDQYYGVERSLELNQQHHALALDIKRAAEARYEVGDGSQSDPLQAEIELAQVELQRVVLVSRKATIVAQMNGLLHQRPDAALPPPPEELEVPDMNLADSAALQKEALSQRPEIRARQAELQGRQQAREAAERGYYPDFGVMASYSSMWPEYQHQWMLGLSVGPRRGAVQQAEARILRAQSQLVGTSDEIRVEVEKARQGLIETQQIVKLYQQRLLPTARAQIDAARAGYVTGRGTFQSLIDAERSLRNVELGYQETLATLGERRGELLRALGQVPGLEQKGSEP
jgi:outer membrane protein TolC